MKNHTVPIALALAIIVTISAFGAAQYLVKCKHPDCGFSKTYFDPNSFSTRAVAGYCAHCKEIVTISSGAVEEKRRRNELKKRGVDISQLPPIQNSIKPKFTLWDPLTGKKRQLYACPKCKNLFFPYNFTYCPDCKRPSLETKQLGGHYD